MKRVGGRSHWRSLEGLIAELETDLTSNSGVHDGAPLVKALAPFHDLIGEAVLVGFYPGLQGKLRPIRSASFFLGNSGTRTLEATYANEQFKRDDQAIDVAEFFLPDGGKCFSVELEHVYCRFARKPADERGQNALASLANLYQRYFLSSTNLQNFIDGVLYNLAKPGEDSGLHPRFLTFPEIADALREDFKVDAAYLVFVGSRERDYRPRAADFPTADNHALADTLSFSADPQFLHKLGLAVRNKQSILGKTEFGKHYAIHPAWDITHRKSPVDGLIVTWSNKPISVTCYRAGGSWLRDFSSRRHLERVKFLNELRMRIDKHIRANAGRRAWGRRARLETIVEVSKWVCVKLCSLTNAESASLRLHDLERDVAKQVARHNTPLGGYPKGLQDDQMAPDIPLKSWRQSAVAFAFQSSSQDNVLHIGDMINLPSAFVGEGLAKVRRSRPESRSEAMIRIRQGGLIAGVFNLESPVVEALTTDIDFLRECGDVMSDFFTRLDTFGDRQSLAEIASTHIALHAVKDWVKRWTPGDMDGAMFIAERLKSHMFGRDRSDGSQYEFNGEILHVNGYEARERLLDAFHNWIGSNLQKVGSPYLSASVLKGHIPDAFPIEGLPSLAVIFDSIWTNVVKFPPIDRYLISLSTPKTTPLNTSLFVIEWHSPKELHDRVERDLIFLRPPGSNDQKHFGFVLLGVHVRLLGGSVALIETEGRPGFVVRITIPCHETESAAP